MYSVNSSNGVITFTPEPTFRGTAPSVTYSVADSFGRVQTATLTPTVQSPPAPTAVNDVTTGLWDANQTINVITNSSSADHANDSAVSIVLSSVKFCASSCAAGQLSTLLSVPNVGSYSVNSLGLVTFDPLPTFSGVAPPVTYQIADSTGQLATATYTATVIGLPQLVPDTTIGPYNTAQVSTVEVNDSPASGTTLNLASLKLYDPSTQTYGTTSVTTAEGTYSILTGQLNSSVPGVFNTSVGAAVDIVFTPLPTFAGSATPVTYQLADVLGQVATTTYTPTVTPPLPPTLSLVTPVLPVSQYQNAVFPNIVGSSPNSVPLATGTGIQVGSPNGPAFVCPVTGASTCTASSVIIPGQGTWTMNRTTGVVTFALAGGVNPGTTLSAVTVQVTDIVGQTATAQFAVAIPPAPTAAPDFSRGQQGSAQVVSLLGNDRPGDPVAGLVPSSVSIHCPVPGASQCSTGHVIIPGEGSYQVNNDGTVLFIPDAAFSGLGAVLTYSVSDDTSQTATSTMQVEVVPPPAPTAVSDYGSAAYGQTVLFSPWTNDDPGTKPTGATQPDPNLVISSIRLCAVGESVPACSASVVTTDDGTYALDAATGMVLFTPVAGFTGTATSPVTYQIANDWTGFTGTGFGTALLVPTIAPPGAPLAVGDRLKTSPGIPVVIDVLANDVPGANALVPSSLRLCGAVEIAPNCTQVTMTVAAGTFVINSDHTITFTPNSNFNEGSNAVVLYVIQDTAGRSSHAGVTVDDPPAPTLPFVPSADQIGTLTHTGMSYLTSPDGAIPFAIGAIVGGIALMYYSAKKSGSRRLNSENA
jgi:CshA-type fibril repeat protein